MRIFHIDFSLSFPKFLKTGSGSCKNYNLNLGDASIECQVPNACDNSFISVANGEVLCQAEGSCTGTTVTVEGRTNLGDTVIWSQKHACDQLFFQNFRSEIGGILRCAFPEACRNTLYLSNSQSTGIRFCIGASACFGPSSAQYSVGGGAVYLCDGCNACDVITYGRRRALSLLDDDGNLVDLIIDDGLFDDGTGQSLRRLRIVSPDNEDQVENKSSVEVNTSGWDETTSVRPSQGEAGRRKVQRRVRGRKNVKSSTIQRGHLLDEEETSRKLKGSKKDNIFGLPSAAPTSSPAPTAPPPPRVAICCDTGSTSCFSCTPSILAPFTDCQICEGTNGCSQAQNSVSPACTAIDIQEACRVAPDLIIDSDQDGVNDCSDACLGTSFGATVDSSGCETIVNNIVVAAAATKSGKKRQI